MRTVSSAVSKRSLLCYALVAVGIWTVVVVRFALLYEGSRWLDAAPRPRGVQLLLKGHDSEHSIDVSERTPVDPPDVVESKKSPWASTRPIKKEDSDSKPQVVEDEEEDEDIPVNLTEKPSQVPIVDGFENPNGLPKLPRLGPPSFFDILAPAYYGKSPVDGSRSHEPFSQRRIAAGCPEAAFADSGIPKSPPRSLPPDVADHISKWSASFIEANSQLCSYGPDEFSLSSFQSDSDDSSAPEYAAYVFHDVCLTFNIDSSKRVQRGLIFFDPLNSHPMRCAACPNPIEMKRWGDHACGLMWTHQVNAKSLSDYARCYRSNSDFTAKIGQRQSPGSDTIGGVFYHQTVGLLSFAYKNPGHQMFDSIFTLLPWIVDGRGLRGRLGVEKLIIQQDPLCNGSKEWFCALIRKMQVIISEDDLIPTFPGIAPCFKSLVVPKWGLFRSQSVPKQLLKKFRDQLYTAFGFDPATVHKDSSKPKMLLYAHNTKSLEVHQHRRIWLDMTKDFSESELVNDIYDINIVADFGALTIEDQARSFFEASVVIMPHGGQFGNAVFARPGTIMIELVCNGYSHLGTTSASKEHLGYVTRGLEFIHIVLVPCACENKGDVDSNFRFSPQSALKKIQEYKDFEPGTYVKKEEC